jgi:hypothetical protein
MADLVAGLKHIGNVQRVLSKRKVQARYLNRAADVSMLSSIVTTRGGCNVQRSSLSCSDATMHSLMLPCMKYRFKIVIGTTQRGPGGETNKSQSLEPGFKGGRLCERARGRQAEDAVGKKHTRSCTHITRPHLTDHRSGLTADQARAAIGRRARVSADTSKTATSMYMYTFLQHKKVAATPRNSAGKHMQGSPSCKAVGIEGLLEALLVIPQQGRVQPVLAPELADQKRHHHERGQAENINIVLTI